METDDKDYTPDDAPEEELLVKSEIAFELEELNDNSNESSTMQNLKKKLKKNKINAKVENIQEQVCKTIYFLQVIKKIMI